MGVTIIETTLQGRCLDNHREHLANGVSLAPNLVLDSTPPHPITVFSPIALWFKAAFLAYFIIFLPHLEYKLHDNRDYVFLFTIPSPALSTMPGTFQ